MTVLTAHNSRRVPPAAASATTTATGWDRTGMAWAHPDPEYLNHWLVARNALLQTIAAATGRLPHETGPRGPK